jgi:hypothetical protein
VQTKEKYGRTKALPIDLHDCGHREQDEKITSELANGVKHHLLDRTMWGRMTGRQSKKFEALEECRKQKEEVFVSTAALCVNLSVDMVKCVSFVRDARGV